MAFNKSKALESALKSLNQGRVADAIREYQQILRQDPKDQVTLMTLGDLFVRQADLHQATEYFERLAQVYLSDGFNSKAIAIYKKIAKLAPNELDPLERLADLYVQQGVLSEARPLFLQIAEGHLKANRAPRAVEVLRRLLEVEPENLRVQMRLAELLNVIGQKGEAAKTYLTYAQRLMERGEFAEVQKLCDRALEVDPTSTAAITLKGQALGQSGNGDKAVELLESLPDASTGGDTTKLILDLLLEGDEFPKAMALARKVFEQGHQFWLFPYRVVSALVQQSQPSEAFVLLKEIREAMIEVGEQDKLLESLTAIAQGLPGEIEPLEALVTLCRETSNSFRLTDAIGQLAQALADAAQFDRAEALLQELVEKKPDDEKLLDRLKQIRDRAAGRVQPSAPEPQTVAVEPVLITPEEPRAAFETALASPTPEPTAPVTNEAPLDEETQRYIAQALTDVDLFSSYGLTQKAITLLESILQRAPRHTPTLERLLDQSLGAGDERRTAELAAQLEQIHTQRGDHASAERFTELRKRFQKVAQISSEDLPPAPPPIPIAPEIQVSSAPAAVEAPAAPEFAVSASPVTVTPEPIPISTAAPPPAVEASAAPAAAPDEIDLSDEWESLSQETVETKPEPVPANQPAWVPPPAPQEPEEITVVEEAEEVEVPESVAPPEPEPVPEPAIQAAVPQPEAEIELVEEQEEEPQEETVELVPAEPVATEKPGSGHRAAAPSKPMTSDQFLSDLAAEFETDEEPAPTPRHAAPPPPAVSKPHAPEPVAPAIAASVAEAPAIAATAEAGDGHLNELAEVFQEFRKELGEMGDEDEDLETHYNLGIAYREMGLLDEAIGEFQKVAKAIQRGKPFRYAMQCSTLLGLTFIDKGEPSIAALWYSRAIETPGLDQETVLALRYDLGVAQDLAGESKAALTSFRQVYAMNIDYRDVAERIATLQKR